MLIYSKTNLKYFLFLFFPITHFIYPENTVNRENKWGQVLILEFWIIGMLEKDRKMRFSPRPVKNTGLLKMTAKISTLCPLIPSHPLLLDVFCQAIYIKNFMDKLILV